MSNPKTFFSYFPNNNVDGQLNILRRDIAHQLYISLQAEYEIQDLRDVKDWDHFVSEISGSHEPVFLIPIITDSYFFSESCTRHAELFLQREQELGRSDLIIPILYDGLVNQQIVLENKLAANLLDREYIDWRQLRGRGFTDSVVRDNVTAIAQRLVSSMHSHGRQPILASEEDAVNEIVEQIKLQLSLIVTGVEQARFRRRFRAQIVRRVIEATFEEIQNLAKPLDEYKQNLSLEENFVVRAGAIFQEASNIGAISIDEVSQFWIAEDQRVRAQSYTARQPVNTKRLFVFSSLESALKYRNVLAAHGERYGEEGAVFLCTVQKYRAFLEEILGSADDHELAHKDFAILVYNDRQGEDYYLATLSKTTLECRRLRSPNVDYKRLLSYFETLAKSLKPGEMHDSGIMKWHPAYKQSDEHWKQALTMLFELNTPEGGAFMKGSVYHFVFLRDVPELASYVNEKIRPKLIELKRPATSEKLVEDFWFGSKSEALRNLSVIDGQYKGRIVTNNTFANEWTHCFIMRFKTIEHLREYYQDKIHSDLRRDLYSFCDENVRALYDWIEASPTASEDRRRSIYQAIERSASTLLIRSDYIQENSILLTNGLNDAVPFDLPDVSALS